MKRSQRGLRRVLWAVACAVWLLFAGAIAVTIWQPTPADPGLADRVQSYQDNEPAAAERLAARNFARNRKQLTSFQSDAGFFTLSDSLREFVSGRLRESDDYQAYLAKLTTTQPPADARSLEELARVEAKLNGELALPPEYTWGETEAAKLRDRWLADVPALRNAEAAWHEWYRGLANQALALTHTRTFDGEWRDRTLALEAAGAKPPFDEAVPIPGSASVPYRVPAEFDRVYQAAKDWEFTRARLAYLRGFADTLGLTPDTTSRLLEIPPPGAPFEPGKVYKLLAFENWALSNFPEPARSVLAAKLREQIGNGAKRTRKLISDHSPADTPDGWRKLGEALKDPAIREWGLFLHTLLKLEDSQAADPVRELAAFLATPAFKLEFTGFELSIPVALRVPALAPAGTLSVTITPATGEAVVFSFKLSGDGTTEGLNTVYRFAVEKAVAVVFRPGDGLKFELPVRSGDQRFTLVWDEGASRTFPFDRWQREPKLVPATGAAEPATGVALAPAFGSKLPRLPLLLPDVKR